jgi:transposase
LTRTHLCVLLDKTTGKVKSKKFKNKKEGYMSAVEWLNKTTGYTPETILVTIEAAGVYHEGIAY